MDGKVHHACKNMAKSFQNLLTQCHVSSQGGLSELNDSFSEL